MPYKHSHDLTSPPHYPCNGLGLSRIASFAPSTKIPYWANTNWTAAVHANPLPTHALEAVPLCDKRETDHAAPDDETL